MGDVFDFPSSVNSGDVQVSPHLEGRKQCSHISIQHKAHLLAVSNVPRARVLRVAQAQLVACTGGAMFFAKGEAWLSGRDFIARLDQWSAPAPLTATNGWFLSSLRGMSNCEEGGVGRSIQCRGRGVSPLLILLQLGGRLLLDTLRAVADSPVDVASVLGVIARLAEDTAAFRLVSRASLTLDKWVRRNARSNPGNVVISTNIEGCHEARLKTHWTALRAEPFATLNSCIFPYVTRA
uniref:(California timema) hypothetical protein n=1 Tax=Timema californicum TaxID=61474 RepID=A0A7R9P332_TIMCA|nr:unnamed protein product [Timema californicum]